MFISLVHFLIELPDFFFARVLTSLFNSSYQSSAKYMHNKNFLLFVGCFFAQLVVSFVV